MKTILDAISKFIAFILAGILIVALPISLLLNDLGDVVFDQEKIEGIAEDVIVNSEIVPAALEFITNRRAEQISTKIENTDRPEGRELNLYNLIASMEDEDWISFQNALLADDVIGGWVVDTIGGFFNWLNSDDPFPNIRWDMKPLLRKMGGQEGNKQWSPIMNPFLTVLTCRWKKCKPSRVIRCPGQRWSRSYASFRPFPTPSRSRSTMMSCKWWWMPPRKNMMRPRLSSRKAAASWVCTP
jgi:hypothetical protein